MNKTISIITVVYNRRKELEDTINSVISQTYSEIDFVIIDGGSTDGTIDVIKKYQNKISYWNSEKDEGIYDAMNKGLKAVNGDYVWFINAGDKIYSDDTIKNIMSIPDDADAYYGNMEYIDESGNSQGTRTLKKPPENLSWRSFLYGMVVSHQSIIVRRDKCAEFNLNYKHCADIDWIIRSLKNCRRIINTNLILSKFLLGGYSKRNIISSNAERYKILRQHFPLMKVWKSHIKLGFNFLKYFFTHKKKLY
jgi:glycosyltransferase involved in cell wall biosynthesis